MDVRMMDGWRMHARMHACKKASKADNQSYNPKTPQNTSCRYDNTQPVVFQIANSSPGQRQGLVGSESNVTGLVEPEGRAKGLQAGLTRKRASTALKSTRSTSRPATEPLPSMFRLWHTAKACFRRLLQRRALCCSDAKLPWCTGSTPCRLAYRHAQQG